MPQQLLHPPQVKSRPHEVDRKAVPERVGVDVHADHQPYFLTMFQIGMFEIEKTGLTLEYLVWSVKQGLGPVLSQGGRRF